MGLTSREKTKVWRESRSWSQANSSAHAGNASWSLHGLVVTAVRVDTSNSTSTDRTSQNRSRAACTTKWTVGREKTALPTPTAPGTPAARRSRAIWFCIFHRYQGLGTDDSIVHRLAVASPWFFFVNDLGSWPRPPASTQFLYFRRKFICNLAVRHFHVSVFCLGSTKSTRSSIIAAVILFDALTAFAWRTLGLV